MPAPGGGVFVNPALNEPFGLTLLEASAAGLPLVATDSGGPNDIVETCGNGLLVDPRRPDAIADAVPADPGRSGTVAALRQRRGGARSRAYDWDRHAARYHGLLAELLGARGRRPRSPSSCWSAISTTRWSAARRRSAIFRRWRSAAGGRRLRRRHRPLLPQRHGGARSSRMRRGPQIMITSVGSEIYHLTRHGVTYDRDAAWAGDHRRRLGPRGGRRADRRHAGLVRRRAPLEQRRLQAQLFRRRRPAAGERVRALLAEHGHSCSMIHSHGRYLDVLPHAGVEGHGGRPCPPSLSVCRTATVFVAGDSGNDIEMLRSSRQAIIVGNYSDDLASRADLEHSYVALGHHARGIIEGVAHFRDAGRCRGYQEGIVTSSTLSVLTLVRGAARTCST